MIPSSWISPLVAALMLGGVAFYNSTLPGPESAEAFHEGAEARIKAIPASFGDWTSRDEPVEKAAIRLLKPNVILSRRYTDSNGRSVGFMFVQCRTARDMAGHYPPNCYPNSGWSIVRTRPIDWPGANGVAYPATEYLFERTFSGEVSQKFVVNTIILPDGRITPDFTALNKQAGNPLARPFGAAQLQLLFFGDTFSPAEREETVREFAAQMEDAIEYLRYAEELKP